jgi:hypothetical protein
MQSELKTIEKAVNPQDQPERFKLSEIAYSGLNLFNGVSTDEIKKELNFPYNIKTYKQMSYHSTINSGLALYEALISKADWKVLPPKDATPAELEQTERIREFMTDMDHSWGEFISEVMSMATYGFAVHEKVYRKRYKSNGSQYNDGLIAWKRLPLRTQESIEKFVYDPEGDELIGCVQNTSAVFDPYGRYSGSKQRVSIPKSKMLHFKIGRHRGDPYGKSPLRDAYLAWRYLTALEEIEANGVAKDLNGVPILFVPSQYLSPEASAEQKATRAIWENALRNLQVNQQHGMMLPLIYDPDTKQPLFKLELLSQTSTGKNFDTVKVKEYYKNLILTSLFSDILQMGMSSTGSFSLGSIKTTLVGLAVQSLAKVISDVINKDLIPQTYDLNGWDSTRKCTIDFDNIEAPSLDEVGKFIQRTASTNFLPRNHDVVNKILDTLGLDAIPEDTDLDDVLTTTNESGASEGMATAGEGTSTGVSGNDLSTLNTENAS